MATRHKKIVATLDTGSSSEWNDDHIIDFSDEITIYENLVGPALTETWELSKTGGGNIPAITFEDHHTFVLLDTNGGTGDISEMKYSLGAGSGNITYINNAPIMNIAVWMKDYATTGKVGEWGLFDNAVDLFTDDQDGAYFRVSANKLYAVTGQGAAETATDITPILGVPEFGNYRIALTSSNCYFYLDDMESPIAVHTTNLPDSDLTMAVGARCDDSIETHIYVDGVGLTRNRYKG